MVALEGTLLDAEINSMRLSTFAPLGAALVLALPGLAAAQPAPPGPPPPPGSHENWDRPHGDGEMASHLQALHDRLAIRPDQEGAWRSAIAAMHPMHGAAGAEHGMRGPEGAAPGHDRDGMMQDMPLPERLAHMQAMLDRHAAMMHERLSRMIEATRSLYAVLDPAQRRTLDTLPGMMGHMAMMHGGMGGHGMEGHGMDGHGMGGRMHPPALPEDPRD